MSVDRDDTAGGKRNHGDHTRHIGLHLASNIQCRGGHLHGRGDQRKLLRVIDMHSVYVLRLLDLQRWRSFVLRVSLLLASGRHHRARSNKGCDE